MYKPYFQRGLPVGDEMNSCASFLQRPAQCASHVTLIVGYEDKDAGQPLVHGSSDVVAMATGKAIGHAVPDAVGAAWNCPPTLDSSERTPSRPSPFPPGLVLPIRCPEFNAVTTSGGTPGPLSMISTTASYLSAVQASAIEPPCGSASIALVMRLSSTAASAGTSIATRTAVRASGTDSEMLAGNRGSAAAAYCRRKAPSSTLSELAGISREVAAPCRECMRLIEVAARSELLFQAASSAFGRLRYSKPSGDELILQIMEQIGDSGPIRLRAGASCSYHGSSGGAWLTGGLRCRDGDVDRALLDVYRHCAAHAGPQLPHAGRSGPVQGRVAEKRRRSGLVARMSTDASSSGPSTADSAASTTACSRPVSWMSGGVIGACARLRCTIRQSRTQIAAWAVEQSRPAHS